MGNATLILGESGSGKSTSLRDLDNKTTVIINVLDKPLPFKGYKAKYNLESKNYLATDNAEMILRAIKKLNDERLDIKTLIIDDFQYVLANEYMRRASEVGYRKFTDIGSNAWKIVKALTEARDDLDCFILTHNYVDVDGKSKIRTIGKMLDDKVNLEGMFTVILHTMLVDNEYKFLTNSDGIHMAKSPMGMFTDKIIDNNLLNVKKTINNYNQEDN
jgi:hypothetical protein